jgi:hypothetical protein
MGDLTKGYTFSAGEVVTPAKLHALVEDATVKASMIGTTELADGAVTAAKLASGITVTVSQLPLAENKVVVGNSSGVGAAIAVDTGTMNPAGFGVKTGGIAATQLASDAVTTAKILDANVTLAKLANIATARLLGRATAGSGVPEELTLGTGLEFSGTALRVTSAVSGGTVTKMEERVVAIDPADHVIWTGSHGLSGLPAMVSISIKCNADELSYTGYSAGDMIPGSHLLWDAGDYDTPAFYWEATSTTITIKRLAVSVNQSLSIPRKSDGTLLAALTTGNQPKFSVVLNAWR